MTVLGVDIGGTGIKGAPVDVRRGALTTERVRLLTPESKKPDDMLDVIADIVGRFEAPSSIGVTFPGVVTGGIIRTAANLDKSWIGVDLAALVFARFGVHVAAINDADAAAVAEGAFGAAKGVRGLVILLTFGTGVGSGMLLDGKLVPNTELGHLEMNGKDAEKQVAEVVREKKKMSWKKWAEPANQYLALVDELLAPDLIVIGGGIDRLQDKWLPLLSARAPIKVATLGNNAGIVGAGMAASRTAPKTV
jgi:polyphosphate glucokinase